MSLKVSECPCEGGRDEERIDPPSPSSFSSSTEEESVDQMVCANLNFCGIEDDLEEKKDVDDSDLPSIRDDSFEGQEKVMAAQISKDMAKNGTDQGMTDNIDEVMSEDSFSLNISSLSLSSPGGAANRWWWTTSSSDASFGPTDANSLSNSVGSNQFDDEVAGETLLTEDMARSPQYTVATRSTDSTSQETMRSPGDEVSQQEMDHDQDEQLDKLSKEADLNGIIYQDFDGSQKKGSDDGIAEESVGFSSDLLAKQDSLSNLSNEDEKKRPQSKEKEEPKGPVVDDDKKEDNNELNNENKCEDQEEKNTKRIGEQRHRAGSIFQRLESMGSKKPKRGGKLIQVTKPAIFAEHYSSMVVANRRHVHFCNDATCDRKQILFVCSCGGVSNRRSGNEGFSVRAPHALDGSVQDGEEKNDHGVGMRKRESLFAKINRQRLAD